MAKATHNTHRESINRRSVLKTAAATLVATSISLPALAASP